MTTAQTRSQEKLHPSDIPTQNKRRHDQSMPVLRTADRQTYVCLPTPLQFRSRTKKQLPIFRWIAVRKDVGAEGFEPPTLCL